MPNQRVIITENILEDLSKALSEISYDNLFVLTDRSTYEHCLPIINIVPEISKAFVIEVEAGDEYKNINQLQYIWQSLSDNGASRHSLLINLGGGMISDIGGFAAATFKRGISTINIPTTLMAAVDAAIGGKTGINFNEIKNEVGAFHEPKCVIIDSRFFHTLNTANILSGYAEMLKHGLISSESILRSLLSFDPFQQADVTAFNHLISESIMVKEEIVKLDPTEQNIRKALNFGHTIGHAIESLSFRKGRGLLHGHAIAIGLVCELYLSYRHQQFPSKVLSEVVNYIKEFYPPFLFTCEDYDSLYALMLHDKKNRGGAINFTLLSKVGGIELDQFLEKEDILLSLDFYRDRFGI